MGGLGGGLGGLGGGPMDMGGAPIDLGLGGEMGGGMGGEMGGVGMPMPGSAPASGPPGGGGAMAPEQAVSPLSMPTDIQWPGTTSNKKRIRSLLKHSKNIKNNLMRKGRSVLAKEEDNKGAKYRFTDIELKLYNAIKAYKIPYQFFAQFQVNNKDKYTVDGAFPQLKIAIEADGKLFHNSPEQINRDRQRDAELARMGWRILRFKEEEIKKNLPKVMQTIYYYINQRVQQLRNLQYQQKNVNNTSY
jgi:very-short-patch-repair endonuclease